MVGRSFGRALAAGLAILVLLIAVGPAAAVQYSSERYTWDDSGSYECGPGNWVDWKAEGGGRFSIRTGTGKADGAFFAHDNYAWHAVDTRRSDGLSLFFSGQGNFKETKATRVAGTIFAFTAVDAGQPFVVRDADGNVLLRDRGSIRETIVFDTLGDDTPGGDFIESISFRANGPHPGLDFDSCSIFG